MKRNLCWIRRDLRLHDHHALSESLKNGDETFIVFVFDEIILDKLKNKNDRRVTLIMESLAEIEEKLNEHHSSLIIRYGDPKTIIPALAEELKVSAVYLNRDYEPYAKSRDEFITKILRKKSIEVNTFKDHVVFEKHEVLNGSRELYKVFTPYKNKWLEVFREQDEVVPEYKCQLKKLARVKKENNSDWYKTIGFHPTENLIKGGSAEALKKLKKFKDHMSDYKKNRDRPDLEATSMLSPYLRMGNLSIRDMVRAALEKNDEGTATWLSELVWRDFYQAILDVYPKVDKHCFKTEFDAIEWLGSKEDFKAWCEGQTGFPIIDASMRCLNETGFMHNRLRMVVASFLTKTLLIDWKAGEKYFAELLLDYDMSANNGGWQWSAGTGVDAQPYFRIFNPYNQSEKFDPDGVFIRKWCPELKHFSNKLIHYPQEAEFTDQQKAKCMIGQNYPAPIVSYKENRERALTMYKKVKPQLK